MKPLVRFFLWSALLLVAGAANVHAQVPGQFTVHCDDGSSFTNGIEFRIIQMRAGYDYKATVVGLNGFDPVLAVLSESGDGLCNDDAPGAARYAANLPTTGVVPASQLSSQVIFNPTSNTDFQDVSLVVGGYNDQPGEFILILEGMGVTAADNGGDPILVTLNQNMLDSGVPLDAYMITRGQSNVDPIVSLVDENYATLTDAGGHAISCDDAGTDRCWGNTVDLSNSTVTISTGSLPGWQYDAYLNLDISGLPLSKDPAENWLQFIMSSYQGSAGQYLAVFHAGL
ncbi:MAG: hypothetical protein U0452_07190 [Anaerolineae bacterium]